MGWRDGGIFPGANMFKGGRDGGSGGGREDQEDGFADVTEVDCQIVMVLRQLIPPF